MIEHTIGSRRKRLASASRSVRWAAWVCTLAVWSTTAATATAQDAARDSRALTAAAMPIDPADAPVIDGALTDKIWQRIDPISDFVQREPREGASPSERTEVRVAFDEHNLYFGLMMFDSEPAKIRRTVLQREGPAGQDDRVMIALDTYYDRRNAYLYELNAFGTQSDAIITDEGSPNWNWESVYWSNATITPEGWSLEVAIPFWSLRFQDTDEPTLGLALYRSIRRKNEEVFWPLIGRDYRAGISQVSRYARLTGLRGLSRARKLQVKPYLLLGGQSPGASTSGADAIRDVGMDVRYAVTSDTTLDLTYNTDFAQVEADNAQVNLTRFSLFFPEKREFFLERNGLFAFGAPNVADGGGGGGFGGPPLEAATYFSRRIGLSQPIVGGARLSGRTGRMSYGLLDLQTGDADEEPGANYAVGRVKLDLDARRSVGAIVTNVDSGQAYNRAAGADMALRFFSSSSLTGWVSKVWTPEPRASTAAGNVSLLLRNDRSSILADYLNVGTHFDPAVGFVRRADMIRYKTEAGWYPRPAAPGIRQLRLTASTFYIEGQDRQKQSTNITGKGTIVFKTLDELTAETARDFDRPTRAFPVAGTFIQPGDYRFTFTKLTARANNSRRVFGDASVGTGTFYGGDRRTVGGSGTIKISPYLSLGANVERNDLRLPLAPDPIATTLAGVHAFLARGRTLYSQWLVQYNSVSRELQANIRVRFLYRPGSDFFFVVNTRQGFDDGRELGIPSLDSRTLISKLTYMISF